MKNYFKKKIEIWKLQHAMEKLSYHAPIVFAAARNSNFKGYTNPCSEPNENTLPPPIGIPSRNHCCECGKKLPIPINGGWKNPYEPDLSSEPTIPINPKLYQKN
jgi:hypothetical protein